MRLPTQHLLRAALRVVGMVDRGGENSGTLDAAYSNDPSDGAYRSGELKLGERILERCGLLALDAGSLRLLPGARNIARLPEAEAFALLVERWLREEQPLWLSMAVGSGVRWEYVPDDAFRRLTEIIPNLAERDRLLLAAARRVDPDRLHELGRDGERHVVAWCKNRLASHDRPDLVRRVVRVSEISDQLGYDVLAPDLTGTPLHIEVKTQAGQRNPMRVFLSRNEAERARRDPQWILVLCERHLDGTVCLRGWCRYDGFRRSLPRDPAATESGRWVTVELRIAREALADGVPLDPTTGNREA